MSSNDEIIALANQAKNFEPANDEQPTTFLSLAPATSSSYPQKKASVSAPDAPAADNAAVGHKRRSSSLSSTTSSTGLRVLKLSPVHWGEHLDDHQLDWYEVAIE